MTAHDIPEARQRSYDIKAPLLRLLPRQAALRGCRDSPCRTRYSLWRVHAAFLAAGLPLQGARPIPAGHPHHGRGPRRLRDKSGRVGVLNRHCTHRGASLEYGLISKHGIRCCYHGWQFDVDGTILDTPGEPSGSRIHLSLKQGAYPAHEHWGLVFAYMGPPEEKPDFPGFEDYGTPEEGIIPYSTWHPCNWLQCHDNFMDPVHAVFLHSRMTGDQLTPRLGQDAGGRVVRDWRWQRHHLRRHPAHGRPTRVEPHQPRDPCPTIARSAPPSRKATSRNTSSATHGTVGWCPSTTPIAGPSAGVIPARRRRWQGRPEACGRDSIDIGAHQHHGGRTYEERQRAPGDWDAQTGQRPIAIHAWSIPAGPIPGS